MRGVVVRGWAEQHRELLVRWSWACADAEIWVLALLLATWMRYDFDVSDIPLAAAVWFAAAAAAAQLLVGAVIGPYAVGHQRGSLEEVTDLARLVGVVGLGLFAWAMLSTPVPLPRSVPLSAALIALLMMCTLRFTIRTVRTQREAGRDAQRRVILLGAGSAGRQLVRSMVLDPQSELVPVALLDDDRSKSRLRIDGVRVRGTRADLADVATTYDATDLIIALPNAESTLIRELTEQAEGLGLRTMVLPPLGQLIGGRPTTSDLRDVALEDLLGRRPIQLDQEAIAGQISGRTVLVTGAGGSIGSELCRQIAAFGPAKLLMLDRDESALHATQLTLSGHGLLDGDDVLLADIRDPEALHALFQHHRPEVVFHAAALKHLPLLERYPLEGWKTNVLGTLNVLTAAQNSGVGTFVNISTDKAADPTCVLGYSKRVAERLTADFARSSDGRYVSVRFGNVLGSRGSVVPAFTAQISQGGPVTVTHPEVRRFFMLIPEACQLVLQSAAMGADGEVMVLDMGEQVKIVDVAQTLIRMSGRHDVQIRFTGLREGEKLAEDLFSGGEARRPSEHELVSCVTVPPLAQADVFHGWQGDSSEVKAWMRAKATSAVSLPIPAPRESCEPLPSPPGGGAPMARIFLSKADVTEVEERYILDAVRSGWVAPLGPHVDAFEAEVAERVGVAGALALASGTAALHLALLELGAGPGTVVVLPSMTFAASANAVAYTGAEPVFVDSQSSDGNVNPQLLIDAIDALLDEGTTVAAVMTVDLFGHCVDYTQIAGALQRRGIPLLEDAAEALGASHHGHTAGSFGRAAALSFNGNKIMTTSGGGMLLSDDLELLERARYLSTQARQPVPWYEHTEIGYNYRLSNVLAALGRAQLSRLDAMIARRREIRQAYADGLADVPGVRVLGRSGTQPDIEDNCWLTTIVLEPGAAAGVDEVIASLGAADIEARHLWKPMHLQKVFAGARCFTDGTSERLFNTGVNLPSGSILTDDDVGKVISAVRRELNPDRRRFPPQLAEPNRRNFS